MSQRIYFLNLVWSPAERSAFSFMTEEERHRHMAQVNAALDQREAAREEWNAQHSAQIAERNAASDAWEAKYGGLTHEQMLQKMGDELKAQLEGPRDTFNCGYRVMLDSKDPERREKAEAFIKAIQEHQAEEPAPDTLEITITYEDGLGQAILTHEDGKQHAVQVQDINLPPIQVLLHPIYDGSELGLAFKSGGRYFRMGTVGPLIGPPAEVTHRQITDRNARHGWALPTELREERAENSQVRAPSVQAFDVHTGQEWTALFQAASDGKSGRYLTANEQKGALRHQRPGAFFFNELLLLDEERDAGHGTDLLRQAVQQLDVDDGVACLYISRLLAPPGPLPDYASATAWIDLDDVARKTLGGYAPNSKEAERRRAKIYHAIRWAARNHVGGKRSTRYFDKQTKDEIETEIYTTPWQIVSREEAAQPAFWPCDAVPRRVELVASREWTALTTHPATVQFLPFGEIIGAIPANQPGGAWARAVGLAYLHWCRLHLHEALRGEAPTRKHLLEQYAVSTMPYEEVLQSKDPIRALKYWKGAEDYLREGQLIEAPGSALKPENRQDWQSAWLRQRPQWQPGPLLRPVLEALAQNKFEAKPRELNPARQRPGRPRKTKPAK
jgi:hypothetical protein